MTYQSNYQWRFELSLREFEGAMREDVRTIRDDMAKEAHRIVVEQTPVAEGVARGNVVLSVGEQSNRFDPHKADPSGAITLAEGRAALTDTDPFAPVFITGTAWYFRWLNDGTRKMRGRHMIQQAVERVARMFG